MTIGDSAFSLRSGALVADPSWAIRLVERSDGYFNGIFSIDNRRLVILGSAGMDTPYTKFEGTLSASQERHFSSISNRENPIIEYDPKKPPF
jgi:hypothetical protein